jgi:tetratricopeptide (TPR) repeat protein
VYHLLRFVPLIFFLGIDFFATVSAAEDDDRAACGRDRGYAAVAACTRSIAAGNLMDSLLAELYYARGREYKRMGELDRAFADYDQTIKLDPGFSDVYNSRASAYSKKGEVDRAIEDYNQLIFLNPGFPEAHYNRALALRARGDFDAAIADYGEAIKTRRKRFSVGEVTELDIAYVLIDRGETFQAKGDLDHAIADYQKAIELYSNSHIAFQSRGNAYLAKGDLDRAIADYGEAIRLGMHRLSTVNRFLMTPMQTLVLRILLWTTGIAVQHILPSKSSRPR